jgi:hypothetical protein
MVVRFRSLQTRVSPHGWGDVLRQLAMLGLAYFVYQLVRGSVGGHATAAFQHARELISLERAAHVFVEPSIQAWASGSRFTMTVAYAAVPSMHVAFALMIGLPLARLLRRRVARVCWALYPRLARTRPEAWQFAPRAGVAAEMT